MINLPSDSIAKIHKAGCPSNAVGTGTGAGNNGPSAGNTVRASAGNPNGSLSIKIGVASNPPLEDIPGVNIPELINMFSESLGLHISLQTPTLQLCTCGSQSENATSSISTPHETSHSTYTPFPNQSEDVRNDKAQIHDEIILISSEGTHHTTSRSLLITHSPYLADIFSAIPFPAPNGEAPDPITLPDTHPSALSLVLAVLTAIDELSDRSLRLIIDLYQARTTEAGLIIAAEAAIMCDNYDIPIFRSAFIEPVVGNPHPHQPLMRYAFAVVTFHTEHIKQIAVDSLSSGLGKDDPPSNPLMSGPSSNNTHQSNSSNSQAFTSDTPQPNSSSRGIFSKALYTTSMANTMEMILLADAWEIVQSGDGVGGIGRDSGD